MKPRLPAFGFALVLFPLVWILDAAIDAAFFYDGTFLDMAFLHVPPIEFFGRVVVAASLLVFAAIVSILLGRSKAGQAALLESNERYRAFFESRPDGVVILEPETARILEFNDQACRQLGYSSEEFGRLAVADLEVMETPEETRGRIDEVLCEGRGDFETRQRTRQGEVRDVHVTATVIKAGGQDVYHCVWRDITERKRAEEAVVESEAKYRSLFDQASDLIFLLELVPDGLPIIRDANPTAVLALGYTWDELVGKPTSLVDAAVSPDALILERQRIARGGGRTFEVQHRRKDGSVFPVEASVKEMVFGGKNLAIAIERDITDRKQLEQALRVSRDRLRGLTEEMERVREEERTSLARELHDEVGQAMAVLKMDLDLIQGRVPGGQDDLTALLASMIAIAEDSVDRVNRLAADLRSPILDVLGLKDAVESLVWEYRERRGIEVNLEMETEELKRVRSRDLTVYRILQAALSNARMHAEAGRIDVSLRVEGEVLGLEVLDDGIGITDEQMQDHRSFGLIGMQERAGRIGGFVRIERRPEGGTRIRASVPIAPREGPVE